MSLPSPHATGRTIVSLLTLFSLLAALASTTFAAPESTEVPPQYQIRQPLHSWETGEGKSYIIPALEVPAFVVALNLFNRIVDPHKVKEGKHAYSTNLSTFWEHLREQDWHYDRDSFEVNQFGHPYEGATFYGFARSTGSSFWQSYLYSHAGSFLWEMGGETSRPSVNDLFTTGNAGSFLGEALFRMSNLVLEDGGARPSARHELAAALISPATGLNRLAFGDRFKSVFPSHQPVTLWQVFAGGSVDSHSSREEHDQNLVAGFSMAYGMPGKSGYTYTRPLDYFDFQLGLRSETENVLETATVRGMLMGEEYEIGNDYRGIWGIYGSYDYLAPKLYRISTAAMSLGTTAQYWLAPGVALQGTLLGGLGFGAAGTEVDEDAERFYYYGATPQALLFLNLTFGDRTMVDVAARGYHVSGSSMDQSVLRGDAGITVRVTGNHGVSLRYTESFRDMESQLPGPRHLSEGTVYLLYTFLSDPNFGAVEWRTP